jgi:Lrp/AsnC family transcriptional regulator, leucine-responsive regulatory protein
MSALDIFDLKILAAVQRDARMPMPDLAEEVGLSAPACYRRMRALRDSGVIEREVAIVEPAVMGWPVTMIVLVSLERDKGPIVDDLVRKLKRSEEVTDVWYVTGDHDLVLHVAAESMAAYDAFTRDILHADDYVRSFETLVVLQQPKRAAALGPATSKRSASGRE